MVKYIYIFLFYGYLIVSLSCEPPSSPSNSGPKKYEKARQWNKLYELGINEFSNEEFESSLETFNKVTSNKPYGFDLAKLIDAYLYTGFLLSRKGKCSLALQEIEKAKAEISTIINRKTKERIENNSLFLIGNTYYLCGEIDSAFSYLLEDYALFNEERELQINQTGYLNSVYALGIMCYEKGLFNSSFLFLDDIHNHLSDTSSLAEAKIQKDLALAYNKLNEFPKAKKLFEEAHVVFQKHKAYRDIVENYFKFGQTGQEDSISSVFLKKGLKLAKEKEFQNFIIEIEKEIGTKHVVNNAFDTALVHLNTALYYALKHNSLLAIQNLKIQLANIYFDLGEIQKPKNILTTINPLNIDSSSTSTKIEYFQIFAKIEKKNGNTDMALDYLERAYKLQSSVLKKTEEKKRQIEDKAVSADFDRLFNRWEAEWEAEAAVEKKFERQIENATSIDNTTNKLTRQLKWILPLIVVFLVFGSIMTFLDRKEERDKLSKELKDEVNSPQYQAKGTITLKSNIKLIYDDILLIEKVSGTNKVIYHTKDGREYIEYISIQKLIEEVLPTPLFIQTNQSYIINILKVKQMPPGQDKIIMINGMEASVTKKAERRKEVFDIIKKY